jgi:hypothetical protein
LIVVILHVYLYLSLLKLDVFLYAAQPRNQRVVKKNFFATNLYGAVMHKQKQTLVYFLLKGYKMMLTVYKINMKYNQFSCVSPV